MQFPVDAEEVVSDLKGEIGHMAATVAAQRSQLRAAEKMVGELRTELDNAMTLARDASAAAGKNDSKPTIIEGDVVKEGDPS